MSSADNLEIFGPRSGPSKRHALSGLKLLDNSTDIFPKYFFRKTQQQQTDFEKLSADDKTMTNYLIGKKSQ